VEIAMKNGLIINWVGIAPGVVAMTLYHFLMNLKGRKNLMGQKTKNLVAEKITDLIKEYGAYCVLANAYSPDSRIAHQQTHKRIQGEADEVLSKINAAILSAISNAKDVSFVNGEIKGIREGH
jgi:hypothetical protein